MEEQSEDFKVMIASMKIENNNPNFNSKIDIKDS
jgi:hypothetical protein